jgi:hypothetical protein
VIATIFMNGLRCLPSSSDAFSAALGSDRKVSFATIRTV